MSTRNYVQINDQEHPPFYLYQHHDGYDLPGIVATALASRAGQARLYDSLHLARIIFSEMLKGSLDDETGYGISTWEPECNVDPVIIRYFDGSDNPVVQIGAGKRYSVAAYITRYTPKAAKPVKA